MTLLKTEYAWESWLESGPVVCVYLKPLLTAWWPWLSLQYHQDCRAADTETSGKYFQPLPVSIPSLQIVCVFQRRQERSPNGFIHSDPQDHHRSHLPGLRLSQGSSIWLSWVLWSLAQENYFTFIVKILKTNAFFVKILLTKNFYETNCISFYRNCLFSPSPVPTKTGKTYNSDRIFD